MSAQDDNEAARREGTPSKDAGSARKDAPSRATADPSGGAGAAPEAEGAAATPATPRSPEAGASPAPEPAEPPPRAPREPAAPLITISVGGSERWNSVFWAVALVLSLVGIVWIAAQVRSVTVPLLVAWAIAYVLDPLVDRFEARGWSRTVAILVLMVVFLVVVTGVVVLVGPQMADELAVLPQTLREAAELFIPWVQDKLGFEVPATVAGFFEAIMQRFEGLDLKAVAAPAGSIVKVLYGGTVGVIAAVAGIVMVPIFTFYLLRDFDRYVRAAAGLVPRHFREGVGNRFREIDHALSSFVRGQLAVAGILAVLYSIGLSIVGIPLALVVGIVSGLGNMIPYLGTTVGIVLGTLMAVLDWGGWLHLVGVWAVFAIVQTLEGYVITPRIVGESVGLSPFAVIVAVLVFGSLFGFFGILLAVPMAAVLKILLRVGLERYRASRFFQAT